MKTVSILSALLPLLLVACAAPAPTAPIQAKASTPTLEGGYVKVAAVAGTQLYFINLQNGDAVSNPVRVQFGLRGMGVAPGDVTLSLPSNFQRQLSAKWLASPSELPGGVSECSRGWSEA